MINARILSLSTLLLPPLMFRAAPSPAISVVEVFVAGGRVASLVAYQPPDTSYTNVHLLSADGRVTAQQLKIWSMGCGWNQTVSEGPH